MALACLSVVTTDGCKSARLDPTGVYQQDLAFYAADSSFNLAYTAIDAAFNFEKANRDALFKLDPGIKHAMDKVRPTAATVVQSYIKARAAYIANPIPANLNGLQLTLAQVQTVMATAQAALPTTTPK